MVGLREVSTKWRIGDRVMNRMEINTIVNFTLLILLWCVGVLAHLIGLWQETHAL